ncbi:hypothetical protein [Chryseobacterium sp. T1]
MKKIFVVLTLLVLTSLKSQVGINTDSPEKMLDINGTVGTRKELRIAGTSSEKGNAGTAGQLFKRQDIEGVGSDSWKTVQIADGTGSLSLFYLNTLTDTSGITYTESKPRGVKYYLDASDADSRDIPNLVDSFNVTRTDNKSKAVVSFQTTVQISTRSPDAQASFACGVFLNKDDEGFKLKAVRTDAVDGMTGSFKIYNLNATFDGLQKGSYKVKIACFNRILTGSNTVLGIGAPVDTNTLNADMAQSTITTSVLQTY